MRGILAFRLQVIKPFVIVTEETKNTGKKSKREIWQKTPTTTYIKKNHIPQYLGGAIAKYIALWLITPKQ